MLEYTKNHKKIPALQEVKNSIGNDIWSSYSQCYTYIAYNAVYKECIELLNYSYSAEKFMMSQLKEHREIPHWKAFHNQIPWYVWNYGNHFTLRQLHAHFYNLCVKIVTDELNEYGDFFETIGYELRLTETPITVSDRVLYSKISFTATKTVTRNKNKTITVTYTDASPKAIIFQIETFRLKYQEYLKRKKVA